MSVDINFKCRTCHTSYCVPARLAGRSAECTKCGQRMHIPYRSPVVKLNEEMLDPDAEPVGTDALEQAAAAEGSGACEEGAQRIEASRTFEEYEPLRKPGKAKKPKAPDEPFVPVPSVLNDIWIPITLCLVFYGLSAKLVLGYIFADERSHAVPAGLIIMILAGLLFYAAVVPITIKVINAAADSFDFKPTNALWLQVIAALSLPTFGVISGMINNGASAAVAFGFVGLCFAVPALAIMFQTDAAKAFQTAAMGSIGYGVSLGGAGLFTWLISAQMIPRWGLNLPWNPPPPPPEQIAGRGKAPSGGSSPAPSPAPAPSPTPAVASANPAAPAAPRADEKLASKLFDMDDKAVAPTPAKSGAVATSNAGRTTTPNAPGTSPNASDKARAMIAGDGGDGLSDDRPAGSKPAAPNAVASAKPAAPKPDPTKPLKSLIEVARQREWTVTVVSVHQPEVSEEELRLLRRQLQEAKYRADSARSEATRLDNDTTDVRSRDTLGRVRIKTVKTNSARVIGEAKVRASKAEAEVKQLTNRVAKLEREKEEFATRRVIAALLEDGRAVELIADGFALTKLADAMRPSSLWTIRGSAKIEQGKMSVRPNELIAVGGPEDGGASPAGPEALAGAPDPIAGSPDATPARPPLAGSPATPRSVEPLNPAIIRE